MNKYRNRKTIHRGIKFDSIAEAEYYDLALWQAEANSQFEIRKNDRNFKVGDQLILREWVEWYNNYWTFTGNSYKAEITYITDYAQQDGYVVLGIRGMEEG